MGQLNTIRHWGPFTRSVVTLPSKQTAATWALVLVLPFTGKRWSIQLMVVRITDP